MPGTARDRVSQGLRLPAGAAEAIRAQLPRVADDVVAAIIAEVPSYEDDLGGRMGSTIRNAVQMALGGFLSLAAGRPGSDPRTPTAPSVEGAYALGRGEARGGRSTEALLSAYRIGARVSWREMSSVAVANGLGAGETAAFAELVFAYIDELSASSVAGHDDELATTGRVRERLLERLARHLLEGAQAEVVTAAAEEAGWAPPATLTALVVPSAQARPVLAALPPATLQVSEVAGLDEAAVLLVPDAQGSARSTALRRIAGRGVVAGPARAWLDVRRSVDRARRAHALGLDGDTEDQLEQLVLTADPEALDDLRAQALAPLGELKPAVAEKLATTLRSWLLHQGRREDVAADLFVHPQTVRYRMGQLRELYGDDLEDPATVLRLVIVLGAIPEVGAMPMPPRPAGRRRLPGVGAGLVSLVLLLGACSPGGSEEAEEPSSSAAAPEPSESSPTEDESAATDGEEYVALGDSYTAAPLVPSTDTSDGCLQSDGNYPHLLAAELGYELTDVSCVGATSTSMIGVQQTQGGAEPAQFAALTRQTDLVTIGVGGNDVRLFETLLQTCFPLTQQDPDGAPCTEELTGSPDDLLPAVRALDTRIEAIVTGIRQRAPRAEVVVVTYPQLLPAEGTCEGAPFASGDYAYVREVNTKLSRALGAGAEAAGAEVVDVLTMSRGHDICSDEPWVNGVQTDPERALGFHPFAVEQEAVAAALTELVG